MGDLPNKYAGGAIISAFESLLIEAVEPRQNRRRGDDLGSVEFIQSEDPELQKRKLRTDLLEALNK